MTKTSQLTVDDYVLFLKESSSNSNNINKILFFIGALFSLLMVGKVIVVEQMGTADIVLFAIGLVIMNLPKLIYYNEMRRTLKSEYINDLTSKFELTFSTNTYIVSTDEQEFESAYSDAEGLYETDHFYVIIINEIRHFPMLKSIFTIKESEKLFELFDIELSK